MYFKINLQITGFESNLSTNTARISNKTKTTKIQWNQNLTRTQSYLRLHKERKWVETIKLSMQLNSPSAKHDLSFCASRQKTTYLRKKNTWKQNGRLRASRHTRSSVNERLSSSPLSKTFLKADWLTDDIRLCDCSTSTWWHSRVCFPRHPLPSLT